MLERRYCPQCKVRDWMDSEIDRWTCSRCGAKWVQTEALKRERRKENKIFAIEAIAVIAGTIVFMELFG